MKRTQKKKVQKKITIKNKEKKGVDNQHLQGLPEQESHEEGRLRYRKGSIRVDRSIKVQYCYPH